jgi:hypothetical protein
MSLKAKLLFSIIPSIAVSLLIIITIYPFGVISSWHVFGINLLLVVQAILLYKKMKENKFPKEKLLLYTILMISILPFQYILIWEILDK